MRQPKASTIILSLLALGSYLFKIVLNALAGLGHDPFSHSVANVSDTFVLDITPASWAFSIWALLNIHMELSLCRLCYNHGISIRSTGVKWLVLFAVYRL
jgi:hypothetical protein